MVQPIEGIFSSSEGKPFLPEGIGNDADRSVDFDGKFFGCGSRAQIVSQENAWLNVPSEVNAVGFPFLQGELFTV